jgi:5-methylthioribose kinase
MARQIDKRKISALFPNELYLNYYIGRIADDYLILNGILIRICLIREIKNEHLNFIEECNKRIYANECKLQNEFMMVYHRLKSPLIGS